MVRNILLVLIIIGSLLVSSCNNLIYFTEDIRNNLNENQLEVLTNEPREFYSLVTDLVCDNEIPIIEIKATDEGLENLYKSLTIG